VDRVPLGHSRRVGRDHTVAGPLKSLNTCTMAQWQWYQNPKTAIWYRSRSDDWLLSNRIGQDGGRGYQVQLQDFVTRYFQDRPARTAIDAGAHTGMTAVAYSGIFEQVLAFEPIPELYQQAQMTLHKNRCSNVELHSFGLGAEATPTVFKYRANNSFGTHRNTKGTIRAQIKPLDDLRIDRVDFIKIDVEGMEAEVIQGAWQTITDNEPLIQFEYKPRFARRQQNYDIEQMCENLQKLDYEIQDKKGVDRGSSKMCDLFALPKKN
jgi:FkbM family methyltransferase